jgi:hypothetical protein
MSVNLNDLTQAQDLVKKAIKSQKQKDREDLCSKATAKVNAFYGDYLKDVDLKNYATNLSTLKELYPIAKTLREFSGGQVFIKAINDAQLTAGVTEPYKPHHGVLKEALDLIHNGSLPGKESQLNDAVFKLNEARVLIKGQKSLLQENIDKVKNSLSKARDGLNDVGKDIQAMGKLVDDLVKDLS